MEREGFILNHSRSREAKAGPQAGQEPGADAEAMEGAAQLLSYRAQDQQPRDGTTHNGLGPPPSVTN